MYGNETRSRKIIFHFSCSSWIFHPDAAVKNENFISLTERFHPPTSTIVQLSFTILNFFQLSSLSCAFEFYFSSLLRFFLIHFGVTNDFFSSFHHFQPTRARDAGALENCCVFNVSPFSKSFHSLLPSHCLFENFMGKIYVRTRRMARERERTSESLGQQQQV